MFNEAWLSDKLLLSEVTTLGISLDNKERTRTYELWQNAYEIMENSNRSVPNNRTLFESGYLTLKRSINLRLKQLDRYFAFESINYSGKGKKDGIFEVLEHFGITRKYTLRKYLHNRNQIEHYDINVVSYEDAIAEAEFVWMFLKLTDLLLKQAPGFYSFTEYSPFSIWNIKNQVCLNFEMIAQSNNKHKVKLSVFGNIEPQKISFKSKQKHFNVNNFKIISRLEYAEIINRNEASINGTNEEGLYFLSEITNPDVISMLYKEIIQEDGIHGFEFENVQRIFRE